MSAAAPWSVKGIDPKAREIAKDLARRSGMTLGEWLNTMILDEDEEDGVVPLARRPHLADVYERRSRARRLDDAYAGSDDTLQRVAASVEAIAARLEASERRATVAIQGVDQAVSGLVRRMDGQDAQLAATGRRMDDIGEELREGHRRLRRIEQEVHPQTADTFKKVEASMGALASRLYDIEERQRTSFNELRARVEDAQAKAPQGFGGEQLAQLGARLDQAQARTSDALRSLESSFGQLDQRLRAAESRTEPAGAREAARFEKLAEALSRQVADSREEMLRRLETAQHEGRLERIERAVQAIGEQAKAAEARSAGAVEAMGREVLNIARNLNGRMERVEGAGAEQVRALGQDLSARLEQRINAADDRHALAIEKLGGEITRISDQLAERIAQSERRSAQALEEIGERLSRSSEKMEQRYDRASGELAERMRLSEERTAQLLADAREAMAQRSEAQSALAPEPPPHPAPAAQPIADWRAAAFPEGFADDGWADPVVDTFPEPPAIHEAAPSADPYQEPPAPDTPQVGGFGRPIAAEARPEPVVFGARPDSEAPFTGFGGADVADALEATAQATSDDFDGETEFVDARSLRRGAGARQALDAARAAMSASEPSAAPRQGFGLKRGGKSKLQERLDKQAKGDGSTVRKTLLASVTAVAVTGGIVWGYNRLIEDVGVPGAEPAEDGQPLALALNPAPSSTSAEAEALSAEAAAALETGDEDAVQTLTSAAEAGSPKAQFHLARLFETGEAGVDVDPSQARAWTERAARGGEPRAMHNLALFLFDGTGGPRDQAEAARWFTRAAEAGLTDSQYNLAKLYEDGADGVAADPAAAYRWYLIAARAGDAEAQAAAERLAPRLADAARRRARAEAAGFQTPPLADDAAV